MLESLFLLKFVQCLLNYFKGDTKEATDLLLFRIFNDELG